MFVVAAPEGGIGATYWLAGPHGYRRRAGRQQRRVPERGAAGPRGGGEPRGRGGTARDPPLRLHRGGLLSGRGPGPGAARTPPYGGAAARGRAHDGEDQMSTGDSRQDDGATTGDETVPLPVVPSGDGAVPVEDGATTVETTEVAGQEPPATRRTALRGRRGRRAPGLVALVVWLAARGDDEVPTTVSRPSPITSPRRHRPPPASATTSRPPRLPDRLHVGPGHHVRRATTTATPTPRPDRPGRPDAARRERRGWTPQGRTSRAAATRCRRRDERRAADRVHGAAEDTRAQSLLVFPTPRTPRGLPRHAARPRGCVRRPG